MTTLTTTLTVSLLDRVTRPARGVANSLLGIRRAADSANGAGFGDRLSNAMTRNEKAIDRARGGAIDAVAGFYALRAAISAPISAAQSFESAMADVQKVVDFSTPDAFATFKKDLMAMSREIPVALNDLAAIAAAAGEAGFAEDDFLRVTEAAAKIGVAFGVSADRAGESLPQMMNAMELTLDQAILLADGINHLSNNMASGAPKVLDFMTGVGADSRQFGFAAEQAAAFGSAMIASGFDANVAATSFRNMGRALTRGESATKRQRSAFAALGMDANRIAAGMQRDAVGTTLRVIDALGALPAEQRAAVSSDLFGNEARALGPLLTNTDLLRQSLGLVGDQAEYAGSAYEEFNVRAQVSEANSRRFRNTVNGLAVAVGNALLPALTDTIAALTPVIVGLTEFADNNPDLVRGVVQVTTAVLGMRLAIAGLKFAGLVGRGGALHMVSLGFNTIGRTAGGLYTAARGSIALQAGLAAMNGASLTRMDRIKAGLRGIGAVTGLNRVAGAAGSLARPLGAVARITGLTAVAQGISAMVAAVAGVSAPVWVPIAIAIAAVGAAGALIYKNWDRISSIFRGVGAAIAERLQPALDTLRPILEWFEPMGASIASAWSGVSDAIGSAITGIGNFLTGDIFAQNILDDGEKASIEASAKDMTNRIIDAIAGLPLRLLGIGANAIQALWQGMKDMMPDLLEWAGTIPTQIKDAVGNIDLKRALNVTSNARRINPVTNTFDRLREMLTGARRFGGPVSAGADYLVGENGPEIVRMGANGSVIPASPTRRALDMARQASGGGTSVGGAHQAPAPNVNVNANVTINGVQDIRGAADEIGRIIADKTADAMRGMHMAAGDL